MSYCCKSSGRRPKCSFPPVYIHLLDKYGNKWPKYPCVRAHIPELVVRRLQLICMLGVQRAHLRWILFLVCCPIKFMAIIKLFAYIFIHGALCTDVVAVIQR